MIYKVSIEIDFSQKFQIFRTIYYQDLHYLQISDNVPHLGYYIHNVTVTVLSGLPVKNICQNCLIAIR